jgi:hypothetical protein
MVQMTHNFGSKQPGVRLLQAAEPLYCIHPQTSFWLTFPLFGKEILDGGFRK